MSIHVSYQPLDAEVVRARILPYICGRGEITDLLKRCTRPTLADQALTPLRSAWFARAAGTDYIDAQRVRHDPDEFLVDSLVQSVFAFCAELWPQSLVYGWASIDFLSNDFPVPEYYQMPITLFQPLANELPVISDRLATLAGWESMGGVVSPGHVSFVRRAVAGELEKLIDTVCSDGWPETGRSLLQSLDYAERNGLSFTEAID